MPDPPPVTPACRDCLDLPFLQLGLAGNAHAMITGDQDLLSLADVSSCHLMTAEQFMSTVLRKA
jgi:predicted nucleic acid-binding protein